MIELVHGDGLGEGETRLETRDYESTTRHCGVTGRIEFQGRHTVEIVIPSSSGDWASLHQND